MPVIWRCRFGYAPSLVERLEYLIRQWSFLQVRQVLLQLRLAADPDDDPVIATLHIKCRMMGTPSEGGLGHGKVMFLHNGLDNGQCREDRLVEVPFAISGAHCGCLVAEATLLGRLLERSSAIFS